MEKEKLLPGWTKADYIVNLVYFVAGLYLSLIVSPITLTRAAFGTIWVFLCFIPCMGFVIFMSREDGIEKIMEEIGLSIPLAISCSAGFLVGCAFNPIVKWTVDWMFL